MTDLGRPSSLRFYKDWIGEGGASFLLGIKLIPMEASLLYELYIIWCQKKRIKNYVPDNYFFADIMRKNVTKERHKFKTGLQVLNRYFIVPPRGEEKPPGIGNMDYYGVCVKNAIDMIEKFKNSCL